VINNIPETEKQLFYWMKKYFISDLTPSLFKNARVDCHSDRFKLDIELKCRRRHYNKLLIEKKKYDSILDSSAIRGTTPMYVNSTPLGVYAFYIGLSPIEWKEEMLPKKTFYNDRKDILKVVGYIDIVESVDLLELKELLNKKI
jgi:hypothetical protein